MSEEFESLYRLVFFSAAVALVVLERIHALRRQPVQLARRWTSNIGLFLIGSVVTAVVIPIGIYSFALSQVPGLLSRLELPFAALAVLTFLLLDLGRYWEHRLFHQVPLLWRLHLVHHSDTQIDVTTSERHHPLEFLLGTAVMMALIAAFGLPAPAVGMYLLVASVIALYSHANLRLPPALDRHLGRLIVTPPVHAVHHSDLPVQTDSNYGSVLTLWDRCFGTWTDPAKVRIPHIGLGYFHLPGDTGLARVLLQPLLFRSDLAYPDRAARGAEPVASATTAADPSPLPLPQAHRDALLGGIVGCVLVGLAMGPTVQEMVAAWSKPSYQYAWLILPMLVYVLGWHHRPASLSAVPRPDFTGVPVAIAAAACWGAAALMNIDVGRQFAFVLALQAIALSTLGWRSYWQLFPTLALLFFMIPAGDLVQPALRTLTVNAIEAFAVVAGLPHSVDGFAVYIGTHRYIVIDDCSGLPYVTLATFLGYSFGLLLYRSLLRIAALALFGGFLGIVSNVLRVNAIVLIDWLRGTQMDLAAHGGLQWLALLIALGVLLHVLSRLSADVESPAPAPAPAAMAPARANSLRRLAPVAAVAPLLLIAAIAVGTSSDELRPPRAGPAGVFPQNLAGWALADPAAAWSVDPHGRTESIGLSYRRDGHDLRVVVVETLAPGAKLPESRLVPQDENAWQQRHVRREVACIASDCITLLHATWQRSKTQQTRHVYHAYGIGDFTTESRLMLRAMHGWQRLTGGRDAPQLIGLDFGDAVPDGSELAVAFRSIRSAVNGEPRVLATSDPFLVRARAMR